MIDNSNTKAEIFKEFKRLRTEAESRAVELPDVVVSCSVRSTKADLLAAVRALEKCISDNEPKQVTLEDVLTSDDEDRRPDKAADKPEIPPAESIYKEDEELKLLNQDIIGKIHSLEQAKAIREKELESLQEFEQELEKTVLMLNNLNEKYLSEEVIHNSGLKEEKDRAEEELEKLKLELGDKKERAEERLSLLKESFENRIKERDEKRRTETEEFLYNLKILRSKEDDDWADESNKRNAALDGIKEEIDRLNEEIKEKEILIPDLKEELDRLPELLEKSRKEGAEERKEELESDFAHRSAIQRMDAEAEIKSLERKIEGLNEDNEALKAERNIIQDKLDKAYEESNKLYLQTIQSTGGVKILSKLE